MVFFFFSLFSLRIIDALQFTVRETDDTSDKSASSDVGQLLLEGADVIDGAQLRPAAQLLVLRWAPPAVQQEEALGGSTVFARHEVVEHGVDGGAEVAQHHRRHVEVLAQLGGVVVVHLGEQVPADVVGQPADDEGQHHHY
ncbi:hypothetical protein CRUP_031695 [Coryphaenoides rupestris]|nr:hypothetical protein CRUP_031695 [Coryphaenoides rupestris]